MLTKEELLQMLDRLGIEYQLNSQNPGIQFRDGRFYPYSEVSLPSEYFKDYESTGHLPLLKVKTETVTFSNYSFNETVSSMESIGCATKYESLGFAA